MTPFEQAQRLIVKYIRIKGSGISYGKSKLFIHLLVDQIIEEIRVNHQSTYHGVERLEYWKQVKQEIDNI